MDSLKTVSDAELILRNGGMGPSVDNIIHAYLRQMKQLEVAMKALGEITDCGSCFGAHFAKAALYDISVLAEGELKPVNL